MRTCSGGMTWAFCAERAVSAVFGWHPAVWWLGRALTLEREVACDDLVLTQERTSPQSYARSLVRLVEQTRPQSGLQLAPGAFVYQAPADPPHRAPAGSHPQRQRETIETGHRFRCRSPLRSGSWPCSRCSSSPLQRPRWPLALSLPGQPGLPHCSNPSAGSLRSARSNAARRSRRQPFRLAALRRKASPQRSRLVSRQLQRWNLTQLPAQVCRLNLRPRILRRQRLPIAIRPPRPHTVTPVELETAADTPPAQRASRRRPGRRRPTPQPPSARPPARARSRPPASSHESASPSREPSSQCVFISSTPATSRSARPSSHRAGCTSWQRRHRCPTARRRSWTNRWIRSIPRRVSPGDVVGIGIHTGNALRGYQLGRMVARAGGDGRVRRHSLDALPRGSLTSTAPRTPWSRATATWCGRTCCTTSSRAR